MAAIATRNSGTFPVNGLGTAYPITSSYLAQQLGSGQVPMALFESGQGSSNGWNSIALTMSSLGGGKTWGVDINLGGAGWVTVKAGLANGDMAIVGPQGIGWLTGGTPSAFLPGIRPAAIRLTLSASDTAGIVSFTVEARSV